MSSAARKPRRKPRRKRARQLELRVPTHGGRRPGAGRPRVRHSRVVHRRRPPLASRFPVHVTMRVQGDVPNLRRGVARRVVMDALVPACERRGYRICHFSVQKDHLHLIVEARDADRLARGMQGLAIRIAKRLNHALGRRGAVWADRYHARILRTPLEVRRALAYVLNNGRHHGPTRRSRPLPRGAFDALSSAFYFDGWRHPLPPMPVHDPPCRPPGTWLLSRGWRRHGLLHVDEGPADTASDRQRR